MSDGTEPLYELPVEVAEAQEWLYLFKGLWYWPVRNSRLFHRVHEKVVWFDDIAEEFDFLYFELAFLWLEEKIIFSNSLEYPLCAFLMDLWIGRKDQHVVHVDY